MRLRLKAFSFKVMLTLLSSTTRTTTHHLTQTYTHKPGIQSPHSNPRKPLLTLSRLELEPFFTMKLLILSIFLCAALLTASAHAQHPSLADLVASSPRLSILVELLKFTGLLDAVVKAKQITIFAPTNTAFKQTAGEVIDCFNRSTVETADCYKSKLGKMYLTRVLTYHVVPGVLGSGAVVRKNQFQTLNGQTFARKGRLLVDQTPRVRNAHLVQNSLDLSYNNGIVHGISLVLLPVPNLKANNLGEVVAKAKKFDILHALLRRTKLDDFFFNGPFYTVFAPTDYAFRQTAKDLKCKTTRTVPDVVQCFIDMFRTDGMAFVLANQRVAGLYTSQRLLRTRSLTSAVDVPIFRKGLMLVDQSPALRNPMLIRGLLDVNYNFGVLHGINRVLLPTNERAKNACDRIELPLFLADGSYMPVFKIVNAAKKCARVRRAVRLCKVISSDICKRGRAKKFISTDDGKIRVGRIAAAAKECFSVVYALELCAM